MNSRSFSRLTNITSCSFLANRRCSSAIRRGLIPLIADNHLPLRRPSS
jgi:hypothetical protein